MTEKRRYSSDLRKAHALATRQAILAAAGRVVLRGGWTGATMAAIATEAGVAKETVTAIFGTKPALMAEVVIAAVSEGRPVLEDPCFAQISAAPDLGLRIDLAAVWLTEILGRVAPYMAMLQIGAASEPEMAALYRRLHEGRRRNLAALAAQLAPQGDPKIETIAAWLWLWASPEAFTLATEIGGQSPADFAMQLGKQLRAALLP